MIEAIIKRKEKSVGFPKLMKSIKEDYEGCIILQNISVEKDCYE